MAIAEAQMVFLYLHSSASPCLTRWAVGVSSNNTSSKALANLHSRMFAESPFTGETPTKRDQVTQPGRASCGSDTGGWTVGPGH